MTPDLKRLCEAAEPSIDQAIIDADWGRDINVEAIVRAVLTELREPRKAAIEAGAVAFDDAVDRSYDSDGNGTMRPCVGLIRGYQTDIFTAMIDAILAEPATA